MRLRNLRAASGSLRLEWRACPVPDPTATLRGTYREAAWRRCAALARDTGIVYRLWDRLDFPTWSLPALEAAKCAAFQGEAAFETLHLRLYRAYFTEGVNIGVREEVLALARTLPELDAARFEADYLAVGGREPVLADYEAAAALGIQAIPTVLAEDGRRVVGAVSEAEYRRLLLG